MSRTEIDTLIYEARQACREADEAHQRALSLAAYKHSALRAALQGGVRAVELADALGLSRERVYRAARGNRLARDLNEKGGSHAS